MIGLEPRHEALAVVLLVLANLPKADEGAHLVNVAADALIEVVQPPHQRIGGIVEQFWAVTQRRQGGI